MKKRQLVITLLLVYAYCVGLSLVAWADVGAYYGTATITAPASLGTVDLAFSLSVSGSTVQRDTSYIMLDKTLLFPSVPPLINNKPAGPRVTGTASGATFTLATDEFSSTVSGKPVRRKVTLNSSTVTDSGNAISGTYTETITGLGKNPITVTGTFILVRPTVQMIVVELKDLNLDRCVDLNEIRGAGTSQNVVEYSEVSQALHLFYNPQTSLRICTEQVMRDALAEFYAAQKQL